MKLRSFRLIGVCVWLASIGLCPLNAQAQTASALPAPLSGADGAATAGAPAASEAMSRAAETVRIVNPSAVVKGDGGVKAGRSSHTNIALAPEANESGVPKIPNVPNEFQKFVMRETGQLLPIFGTDFFVNGRHFAPSMNVPVAGDYPLGPGDEIVIRGWGAVDIDFRDTIGNDGAIVIPKVGTVTLAGVRVADAELVIRTAMSKMFRGFTLNVTIGKLRGITIYVVGQARRPGTYQVSSLSTVVTALFESGGPGANGSLRRIQVKRGGNVVTEVDLYRFLASGDKSADIRLLDGDVIVIPPALGFVALTGKVEVPAIYEIKGQNDTIRSFLDVAGGLPIVADPRRAFIERIDPTHRAPRSVDEFALDTSGLAKELKSGDLISVMSITAEFSNAVTLRGAMRVPYREGMKITDMIPSREFLLSRMVIRRKNASLVGESGKALLETIGNRYDELNWDYAVVERIQRANFSESLVSFNLGRALAEPDSAENIALQPGDTITVFAADDLRIPVSKRKVFVRIEGEVRRPGVYQLSSAENLINLVEKAGGLTADAFIYGSEFERESVRVSQQRNLDAFIRRIEQQGLSEVGKIAANATDAQQNALQSRLAFEQESRQRLIQRMRDLKSSGRIALNLSGVDVSVANLPAIGLENGDRFHIPPQPSTVQLVGAVGIEAALFWQPGRSISDYLAMAGVSRDADSDAITVLRADGTVKSNSSSWLSMASVAGLSSLPGDLIIVPEIANKESAWTLFFRGAKDLTQVLYNFGLGAAALKTLRGN